MQEELSALLKKDGIQEVDAGDCQAGFPSRSFLVPKREGCLSPMLDLRGLNCYLCPLIYKMLMVPKVKQAISFGDWFATIDLKVIYCFPLRHLSCTLDLHVMHGRCPWFYEDTGPQGP